MTHKELMTMDRSLPPVVITAEDRKEYMLKCDEVVKNFKQQLAEIYTDESKKYHSFNGYWQLTQGVIAKALARHYQFTPSLLTRRDFKAVVAYGVYQAYVTYDATRDYRNTQRTYDKSRDKLWIAESLAKVTRDCYQMISLNNMENK